MQRVQARHIYPKISTIPFYHLLWCVKGSDGLANRVCPLLQSRWSDHMDAQADLWSASSLFTNPWRQVFACQGPYKWFIPLSVCFVNELGQYMRFWYLSSYHCYQGIRTSDQRLCYSLIGKYHIKTCSKGNFTILAWHYSWAKLDGKPHLQSLARTFSTRTHKVRKYMKARAKFKPLLDMHAQRYEHAISYKISLTQKWKKKLTLMNLKSMTSNYMSNYL